MMGRKPKTLYVSDLDGTLLQPGAFVSEASAEMLNRVIADGACFTIATARTPATVAPILKDIELRLPAIVMTGAALWDKNTREYSNVHYIDDATSHELVRIYREMNFPTFLYTLREDHLIHIYHLGQLNRLEVQFIEERRNNPFKQFHIPESGDSELPEYLGDTILFYGIQPDVISCPTYARTSCVATCRAMKYYDFYGPEIGIVEAFSTESTKAKAIRALAEANGIERIVAFGDNLNDLPMLEIADVAVAVENAIPEVKERADVIIGPNTADSVARFILEDYE